MAVMERAFAIGGKIEPEVDQDVSAVRAGLAYRQCAASQQSAYGELDATGHRRILIETGQFLHVYLNGHDVTAHCLAADDLAGWVRLRKPLPVAIFGVVLRSSMNASWRYAGRVYIEPGPDECAGW